MQYQSVGFALLRSERPTPLKGYCFDIGPSSLDAFFRWTDRVEASGDGPISFNDSANDLQGVAVSPRLLIVPVRIIRETTREALLPDL
jgi:hypothetical protein